MHSIGGGCPKVVSHSDHFRDWLAHLASILSLNVKVIHKSIIIALLKLSKNRQQFALFLDEFYLIDPEGISCIA